MSNITAFLDNIPKPILEGGIAFIIVGAVALAILLFFYIKSNYPDSQTMYTLFYLGRKNEVTSLLDSIFALFKKDQSKVDSEQQEYEKEVIVAYQRLNRKCSIEEHYQKIENTQKNFFLGAAVIVLVGVAFNQLATAIILAVVCAFLGLSSKSIIDSGLGRDIKTLNTGVNFELSKLCYNFAATGKSLTLSDTLINFQPYAVFLKSDIDRFKSTTNMTLDLNALIELSDRVTMTSPLPNMIEFSQLVYSLYNQDVDPVVTELNFSKLGDRIRMEESEAHIQETEKRFSTQLLMVGVSLAFSAAIFMAPYVIDALNSKALM